MRDWKQYVREHLPPLELSGAREQEIVEEITQQLEGAYSEAISRGLTREQADAHAIAQIPDWSALAHEIRKADQPVTEMVNAAMPEDWREAMREENFRKRRGGNFMADFLQDIRYAFRMLRNSPGITTVVILTLALGIGANSAIFSVVNSVLLRPLPYRDSASLVWITNKLPARSQPLVFDADYFAWRKHCTSFAEITAYSPGSEYTLTGVGEAERIIGVRATYTYLRTLGISPQLGREISADEDRPAAPHVALLSDAPLAPAFFRGSRCCRAARLPSTENSTQLSECCRAVLNFRKAARPSYLFRLPSRTRKFPPFGQSCLCKSSRV